MRKNLKLAFVLIFILMFAGCNEVPQPRVYQPDTAVEPIKISEQESVRSDIPPEPVSTALQLVKIGGTGSCSQFALQDANGHEVQVSEEIKENLNCATPALSISPNNTYLLYDFFDPKTRYINLKLYNFAKKTAENLMSFNETLDGLDCIWRADSSIIACVAINQQDYADLTKIFILAINSDGGLLEKKVFPQKDDGTVDFVCGATCYPGKFWFEGNNVLKYNGHEELSPGQVYAIKY